jgi:hypothetical protein
MVLDLSGNELLGTAAWLSRAPPPPASALPTPICSTPLLRSLLMSASGTASPLLFLSGTDSGYRTMFEPVEVNTSRSYTADDGAHYWVADLPIDQVLPRMLQVQDTLARFILKVLQDPELCRAAFMIFEHEDGPRILYFYLCYNMMCVGVYKDLRSGELYREHPLFSIDPDAFCIILYAGKYHYIIGLTDILFR